MRARSFFSFVVALAAASALVSTSGAATTRTHRFARFDVSSRAAVIRYLRSANVDTKGLVIQRGTRNYAGASCPGKGWTCTSTAHTVVQIARRGGRNSFSCGTGKCRVLQVATAPSTATNTARCVINTTGQIQLQACLIVQWSATANNVAVVYENANGPSGLTQTAALGASITQQATGASNTNTACVYQGIAIDGSATVGSRNVGVSLGAHQLVTIRQDSANGGNSASSSATAAGSCDPTHPVTQNQTVSSAVNGSSGITQSENAGNYGANMTIDVEQNQDAGFLGVAHGANAASFEQDNVLTAIANTPHGPVAQTQSSPTGGLLGTVNQDSRDPSTIAATQHETQCEDAATSGLTTCKTGSGNADFNGTYAPSQTQYGPDGVWSARNHHGGRRQIAGVRKGVGTAKQTGNSADTFTVTQSSTQDNDQGAGSNQSNVVQGDCSTAGSCNIGQQTNVGGQTTTNNQSGQNLNTGVNCTGSSCQTTAPPTPSIDQEPPNPDTSTSPQFQFSDSEAGVTFLCELDASAYSPCTSPQAYDGLAYGSHTFSVEAKDSNGNVSNNPASYTWTIVPPAPTLLTAPASPSNSPEAMFTFSDTDSSLTFLCSLDGNGYTPCSSGETYDGLADGSHTFSIEATDGSGHTSSATSYSWTVSVFTWNEGMTQLAATNVDIGEFGYGGMRGSGTGSIDVAGVTGTVLRAYLYWNGPTNSNDPSSNAAVTFDGTPISGTNIGTASDNNWGFLNGQSYRADVTSLVSGDGTYSLSDFVKPDADINGVALIVFYDDGNPADARNIVLWNGNQSNVGPGPGYAAQGWDETLTGVPYPGSGSASLDLVVSDGQYIYDDAALLVNGTTVAPAGNVFGGESVPANATEAANDGGSLWDIESFDITSLLSSGSNSLEITTGVNEDYISLVVAIANMPASAPPLIP